MPDLDAEGLTQHQLDLIAGYELHAEMVQVVGRTAELDMDAWVQQRTTDDCAFLLRYLSARQAANNRLREARSHEHPRRPN